MNVVVADTSPLNYLIQIQQVSLLPRLFGEIAAPQAVLNESKEPGAPRVVARWATDHPTWLIVSTAPLLLDERV